MSDRVFVDDLARGRTWTPLQTAVLMATEPRINLIGGRRLGKSYVGAAKFLSRVFGRIHGFAEQVRRGERSVWGGLKLRPGHARQLDPDVEAWVVAPRDLHLNRCRANLLGYFSGQRARLLYPGLGLADSGRQLWLLSGGVVARIRFAVAGSVSSMVSTGVHELWVEESGLTDNQVIAALDPVTWEYGGHRITTGTPALGTEHWSTRSALAGIGPEHPFFIKDVVDRDLGTRTFTGTSFDSPLKEVREAAAQATKVSGEDWADQWVKGDWRLKSIYIYSEFDPNLHLVDYDHRRHILHGVSLRAPDLVLGVIDWAYSDTRPGASVVLHIWLRNPLATGDNTRPLIVAVDDRREVMPYTREGWYRTWGDWRREYGIPYWIADPSRHELIKSAGKHLNTIGPVRPAPKADKPGRITIVKSWLHHQVGISPSFYVSNRCKILPRELPDYRRKFKASGAISEDPYDYDDDCLDCVAFAAGHLTEGGFVIPRLPYS